MRKTVPIVLYIVLVLLALVCEVLTGCKSAHKVTQLETDSVRVEYKFKDTVIYIPGDSVRLQVVIPCPEANWSGKATSGKTSLNASLKNGLLNVECDSDSLQLRIKLLEKELVQKSKTTVNVPVPYEVIRYRVPWIYKVTLWISVISLLGFLIKHRKLVASGISGLIKFFV